MSDIGPGRLSVGRAAEQITWAMVTMAWQWHIKKVFIIKRSSETWIGNIG